MTRKIERDRATHTQVLFSFNDDDVKTRFPLFFLSMSFPPLLWRIYGVVVLKLDERRKLERQRKRERNNGGKTKRDKGRKKLTSLVLLFSLCLVVFGHAVQCTACFFLVVVFRPPLSAYTFFPSIFTLTAQTTAVLTYQIG